MADELFVAAEAVKLLDEDLDGVIRILEAAGDWSRGVALAAIAPNVSSNSSASLFFSTTGKPSISHMFDGRFLKFFI